MSVRRISTFRHLAVAVGVVAVCAAGCSGGGGSMGQRGSEASTAGSQSASPPGDDSQAQGSADDANAEQQTAFDGTAMDIIQHNRPPEQAEIEGPHAFSGCADCAADEFCDRDRCTPPGRGGIAYEGGMLGHACFGPDAGISQLDPRFSEVCQGHLCIDGTCVSCRTDVDCCLLDSDPAPCEAAGGGTLACLWWARIDSNICLSRNGLAIYGVDVPES